jgi:hypothetical protein
VRPPSWRLKYDAYTHQNDKDGALRVVASFPEGPFESQRLDFLVGRAHFETGDPTAALRLLDHAVAREPALRRRTTPSLVHETLGDARSMVNAFLRAREADLILPPVFWSPSRVAFEEHVRAAMQHLPAPMLASLAGAELIVPRTRLSRAEETHRRSGGAFDIVHRARPSPQ